MKLDRLMGILTILLQTDRVTAPYLAQRFEVTRRTIGRDIDALCRAGIPVVTQQGSGGGISIAKGFRLDKSVLTSDELASLVAGLRGIGSVSGKAPLETVLDKLAPGAVVSLREPIIIDLASHYKGSLTEKIEQIKQAIHHSRVVEFDYHYDKGKVHRAVEPYFVVFQWTAWYLFGYCRLRQDFRLFKLTRLWNLQLCDEGYAPRDIPPKAMDFNARLTDHLRLVALFEPSARYQLIDSYGPASYIEAEDGRLRLEIGYTNEGHMLEWLLAFGSRVTVLQPLSLAAAIRAEAEKMVAQYP